MGRNRVPPIPLLITAVPLTSLTLIVWIISVVALRQQLPPSTTPPKLSVPTPYLVYVTPAIPAGAEEQKAWFEKVQQCAQAGVPLVQIRDKVLSAEALAPHVTRCREQLDAAAAHYWQPQQQHTHPKTLLIINGHPEMHIGLDGVHFPEDSLERVSMVLFREQKRQEEKEEEEEEKQRQQLAFVTGVSVHSVEAAVKAAQMGVDYLQVGTMYLTGSHPEKLEVEGTALMTAIDTALREAQLRDRVLICGIGGITPANCEAVLRAGADGVAVISGIAAVDNDVPRTVAAFREVFARLDTASKNRGDACL